MSHVAGTTDADAGECRMCSACQLRDWRGDAARVTTWQRRAGRNGTIELQAQPLLLEHVIPPSELRGRYSVALYGARDATPAAHALRILWLDLLTSEELARAAAVGVCSRAGGDALQPFFASPHRAAVWVHHPATVTHRALPSHAWAEVTHCALRPPGRAGHGLARTQGWKFSPMWLFVAPGSGVSLNIGRTRVVRSYSEAAAILAAAFPGGYAGGGCDEGERSLLRLARGGGGDDGGGGHQRSRPRRAAALRPFDTLQIVNHTEYYSHQPHHEIVDLRFEECHTLTRSLGPLRCGRHPHLRRCEPDSEALRRVTTCGGGRVEALGELWDRRLGPQRDGYLCASSAGCYADAKEGLWCPRGAARAAVAALARTIAT